VENTEGEESGVPEVRYSIAVREKKKGKKKMPAGTEISPSALDSWENTRRGGGGCLGTFCHGLRVGKRRRKKDSQRSGGQSETIQTENGEKGEGIFDFGHSDWFQFIRDYIEGEGLGMKKQRRNLYPFLNLQYKREGRERRRRVICDPRLSHKRSRPRGVPGNCSIYFF